MNMRQVAAIVTAMQKGSELANPALWKNVSAATAVVTSVLWALINLLGVFDVSFMLSKEQVDAIAVLVVAAVSVYFTFATSTKVGLPAPGPGPDAGVQAGPETTPTAPGDMHGNP
jgi:hypothetical protein